MFFDASSRDHYVSIRRIQGGIHGKISRLVRYASQPMSMVRMDPEGCGFHQGHKCIVSMKVRAYDAAETEPHLSPK